MLRLGQTKESLGVVFDQTGTPTCATDLAAAILQIVAHINPAKHYAATYHYSNEGVCSWYDFATAIMDIANLPCHISPVETKDYPTPAARPPYSVLNKTKIKHDFGITIPHWQTSLKQCIMEYLNG